MPSVIEAKPDLAKLAERLRIVAETLKRLPTDHPSFVEEMEVLRHEIKAVAAQLRGNDSPPNEGCPQGRGVSVKTLDHK